MMKFYELRQKIGIDDRVSFYTLCFLLKNFQWYVKLIS